MNVLFLYTVASLVASAECIAKFGVFLQELKPSQREAFRLIVKENLGKPKSQLRRDLDKFVLTVPTPLQELFNLQRQAIQHRSNTLKAAEKIQFLNELPSIHYSFVPDQLSSRAMKYQILIILAVAGLVVAGPFQQLKAKLNPQQKEQLKKLVKDDEDQPDDKKQQDFEDFLDGLDIPEQLKEMFAKHKKIIDDLFEEAEKDL
uniref:Uncharacterized protein n=1 Tax=Bursaphelenchus xylophilus TaxID=6326 RepID=A0A1I7SF44_BURXY